MSRIPLALREQIRNRANNRCEYCLKPEEFSAHSFHVDHIISQKHHGSDEVDNLAWACFRCNTCKGTDIASVDLPTHTVSTFYNLLIQHWENNFYLDRQSAEIVGITSAGRVTVETFQVNHPDQIETRRILLDEEVWD